MEYQCSEMCTLVHRLQSQLAASEKTRKEAASRAEKEVWRKAEATLVKLFWWDSDDGPVIDRDTAIEAIRAACPEAFEKGEKDE